MLDLPSLPLDQRSFLTIRFILVIKFTVLKSHGNSLYPVEGFSSQLRPELDQGSCSGEEECDFFLYFSTSSPFLFLAS